MYPLQMVRTRINCIYVSKELRTVAGITGSMFAFNIFSVALPILFTIIVSFYSSSLLVLLTPSNQNVTG